MPDVTGLGGGVFESKSCFGLSDWNFLSADVPLLYLSIQSTAKNFFAGRTFLKY